MFTAHGIAAQAPKQKHIPSVKVIRNWCDARVQLTRCHLKAVCKARLRLYPGSISTDGSKRKAQGAKREIHCATINTYNDSHPTNPWGSPVQNLMTMRPVPHATAEDLATFDRLELRDYVPDEHRDNPAECFAAGTADNAPAAQLETDNFLSGNKKETVTQKCVHHAAEKIKEKSEVRAAACCLVLCTPPLDQELVCRKLSRGLLGT